MNWFLPHTALYRLRQKYDPDFQRKHGAGHHHGYDANQPRVPRGHHDGGQWTRDGSGESLPPPTLFQRVPADDEDAPQAEPVFLRLLSEAGKRLLPKVGGRLGGAAAKTIESELALFTALSQKNSRDQQAVFQFNAKQFGPNEQGKLDSGTATALTFAQVERVCPGCKGEEVDRPSSRSGGSG